MVIQESDERVLVVLWITGAYLNLFGKVIKKLLRLTKVHS